MKVRKERKIKEKNTSGNKGRQEGRKEGNISKNC